MARLGERARPCRISIAFQLSQSVVRACVTFPQKALRLDQLPVLFIDLQLFLILSPILEDTRLTWYL